MAQHSQSENPGPAKMKSPPAQHQAKQPGEESLMHPAPEYIRENYLGSGKLEGRVAMVTGGDSGIGRAVAVTFAREGADVTLVYLEEDEDAEKTKELVENEGRSCLLQRGDIGEREFCKKAVEKTVSNFGQLDVLVNNAAEQHAEEEFEKITDENLQRTFRTNIFSMIYLTQAALPYLKQSSHAAIVNSTSVTAYRGHPGLIDYSSTKGAIVALTRSLAKNLAEHNIRVNAIAPGPIWTPLIPATFPKEKVDSFGGHVPMGRPGQPSECAPGYLYLACEDSSYVTGQVFISMAVR